MNLLTDQEAHFLELEVVASTVIRVAPTSFEPTKTHPIRSYCKRVTIWIKDINSNKRYILHKTAYNSLEGSCSINTLGVQFERLKNEANGFEVFPIIDKMFYFLLATQNLTFYCKTLDGQVKRVETYCESIPPKLWQSTTEKIALK